MSADLKSVIEAAWEARDGISTATTGEIREVERYRLFGPEFAAQIGAGFIDIDRATMDQPVIGPVTVMAGLNPRAIFVIGALCGHHAWPARTSGAAPDALVDASSALPLLTGRASALAPP